MGSIFGLGCENDGVEKCTRKAIEGTIRSPEAIGGLEARRVGGRDGPSCRAYSPHIRRSEDQNLVLAFRGKSSTPFKWFLPRSTAEWQSNRR